MRHLSTAQMIERLTGLLGTNDLNAWEQDFVSSLQRHAAAGKVTNLTDKQVERLDELHAKHFG